MLKYFGGSAKESTESSQGVVEPQGAIDASHQPGSLIDHSQQPIRIFKRDAVIIPADMKARIDDTPGQLLEGDLLRIQYFVLTNVLQDGVGSVASETKTPAALRESLVVDGLLELVTQTISSYSEQVEVEPDVLNQLQKMLPMVKIKDYESVWNACDEITTHIRPFDTHECISLIQKSRAEAEKIRDQDIVMMLGRTGVGKSTLMHFLGGSKLSLQTTESGLVHIGPSELGCAELQNVITNPEQRSETRYVSAVPINFRQAGLSKDGGFILCDTPGFEDTGGAEIDIANAAGVITAICQAKSVRPVMLFSQKSFGDRGDLLRKMAHMLLNIVTNIEDTIESFTFLFTKYSADELPQIHPTLQSIQRNAADQEKDQAFEILFDALLEATDPDDGQPLSYDPLKDDRKVLVRRLQKAKKILDPSEVFRFSSSAESQAKLKEQLVCDERIVAHACTAGHLAVVNFKLKQVKKLSEMLDNTIVNQAYDRMVKIVIDAITQDYQIAQRTFTEFLSDARLLDEKLVDQVTTYQDRVCHFSLLREGFLGSDVVSAEAMNMAVKEIITQFIEQSKALPIEDKSLPLRISKLKCLTARNGFSEYQDAYAQLCSELAAKFKATLSQVAAHWDQGNFSQCAEILDQVDKQSKEFGGAIADYSIHDDYQATVVNCRERLSAFADAVVALFKSETIGEQQMTELQSIVASFESATATYQLYQHLSEEYFEGSKAKLTDAIVTFFAKFRESILEEFDSVKEHGFDVMKQSIEMLTKIHQIPGVTAITAKDYEATIQTLCGIVRDLRRDIEVLAHSFMEEQDHVDCRKLSDGLVLLRKATWLDTYQPGIIAGTMEELTASISRHIKEQVDHFQARPLAISDIERMQRAVVTFNRLTAIASLDAGVPELKEVRSGFNDWILRQVQRHLSDIMQQYNIQFRELALLNDLKRSCETVRSQAQIEARQAKSEFFEQNKIRPEDLEESQLAKIKEEIASCEQLILGYSTELSKISSECRDLERLAKDYSDAESAKQEAEQTRTYASSVVNGLTKVFGLQQDAIKKRGFESLDHLQATIQEKLSKQGSFELQIKQSTDKQAGLERDLAARVDLNNQVQAQQKTIQKHTDEKIAASLLQHRINNEAELDEALQTLQSRLSDQSCEVLGENAFVERPFDATHAEAVIVFLNACAVLPMIADLAQYDQAKAMFNAFVKRHMTDVEAEIHGNFDAVKATQPDSIDRQQVQAQAQIVSREFRYVQEISQHLPNLATHLPKQIVENFTANLETYYVELNENIARFQAAKHTAGLETSMVVARALCPFDSYMQEGCKFLQLYMECNKRFYEETTIGAEIFTAIQKQDFSTVAYQLVRFTQTENEATARAAQQIIDAQNRSLADFIRETEDLVTMLPGYIDGNVGPFKTIKQNCDKLSSASTLLGMHLGATDEQIRQCITDIKQRVSERLLHYLGIIDASLSSGNFKDADEGMEFIRRAMSLLGSCAKEVSMKLEEVEKSIEDVLQTIIKDYSKMTLREYNLKPPREIFEQFKRAESHNKRYARAKETIRQAIYEKCLKELQAARTLAKPVQRNEHMRAVKTAVRFLPDDLKVGLESDIDHATLEIEDLIEASKGEVKELLETDNIQGYREYLDINIESKAATQSVKVLITHVAGEVKLLRDRIMQALGANQHDVAVTDLKRLCEYRFYMGDVQATIPTHFSSIQDCVRTLVVQMQKSLREEFSKPLHESADSHERSEHLRENFQALIYFVDLYMHIHSRYCISEGTEASHATRSAAIMNLMPEDFLAQQLNLQSVLVECFGELESKAKNSLEQYQMDLLADCLAHLQRWDRFIAVMKGYADAYRTHPDLKAEELSILARRISYAPFVKSVCSVLNAVVSDLQEIHILNEHTKGEGKKKTRDKFFGRVAQQLSAVRQVSSTLSGHIADLHSRGGLSKKIVMAQEHITKELQGAISFVTSAMKQHSLSTKDFHEVNDRVSILQACLSLPLDFLASCNPMLDIERVILERCTRYETAAKIAIDEDTIDPSKIFTQVLKIKTIGFYIHHVKDSVYHSIEGLFKRIKKKPNGAKCIAQLGLLFNQEPDGIGRLVLEDHNCFKGYAISLFNEKTQKHGIDHVLTHLSGSGVDHEKLSQQYVTFDTVYKRLIKSHLKPGVDLSDLIAEVKAITSSHQCKIRDRKVSWTKSTRDIVPSALAHLFALWTLKNAEHYFDADGVDNQGSYLLQPHAAQVVAIFRLLGLDIKLAKGTRPLLLNNLAQIGTGEGKSVTLAMSASLLSLLGCRVSCACYSAYLSERDYNDFRAIFDTLGVAESIHYGTFDKLCESVINEEGSVRDRVTSLVSSGEMSSTKASTRGRPHVLLVDEVDVFFSTDFYGNIYHPVASLVDPVVQDLVQYIWSHRDKINLTTLQRQSVYKACCDRYGDWSSLITEAVKDMLQDVKSFQSHGYVVREDKIGYPQQDGIVYNVRYGYKTQFAYWYEHERGKITEASRNEHTSISVSCGYFSYAEVPKLFNSILGVTGTLKTLNRAQRKIITGDYNVGTESYMPSVFGANQLVFSPIEDVHVEKTADYFNRIRREIDNRIVGADGAKRSVLVFFESIEKLNDFRSSEAFSELSGAAHILTEETDTSEKDQMIKMATMSGQVTLLTRAFGRGTDFVCRDEMVRTKGGVHVIQTFLSAEVSEETQIKGRTARQGDQGSYSLVLDVKSLEYFHVTEAEVDRAREEQALYRLLDKKRNKFFDEKYAEDTRHIDELRETHDKSMSFLEKICDGDVEPLREYLLQNNAGSEGAVQSRTICLLDGTGSMGHLLQKTKTTVCEMFKRASSVLRENGLPENAFELQFAVYRNYDCKADKLLQISSWEAKPENLREFMEGVQAEGGTWYPEAVEIGLWHANHESEQGQVDQVILIGDAEANSPKLVDQGRAKYHGDAYWATTPYHAKTNSEVELTKLRDKGIPVHAYHVVKYDETVRFFKSAAKKTGGRNEFLDVNSSSGAGMLTDMVTVEVLRNVGQRSGQSDKLVESYKEKFGTSYT